MSYTMLAGPGVAPQALSQPSPNTGISVMSQTTATAIKNTWSDPKSHLVVQYSQYETPYKSNMVCPSGIASVNNDCLCPGSQSGVPYRQSIPVFSKNYVNTLFSPIQADMFPQPSAAAQYLIQERGPCPASAYRAMDTAPLTQCLPAKCI